MGKRFLRDALPPYLTVRETSRTVEGNGEKWNAAKQRVSDGWVEMHHVV